MVASQSLYVSIPIVNIKGADAESMKAFRNDILQITVEESMHLPGMFTIVINNPYAPLDSETKTWQHDKLLQIGNSVKIGFIGSSTEAPEFDDKRSDYPIVEGEITAIETHFISGTQAPIVIRGYDVSHRLHRGRYNRSFQDITDSDIVKKIAAEVDIAIAQVEPSGDPHQYVFQENQTNMEFLRERAARIGFELFVQDNKLFFRNPQAKESLNLEWLRDIESFRVRVTSAEQVSAVEVRSWDYSKKREIVETIETDQVITRIDNPSSSNSTNPSSNSPGQTAPVNTEGKFNRGSATSTKFGRNVPKPKMVVADKPVFSDKQAKVMAQALFNELGGEFVCADARAPGDPRIRVGKVVELKGMGRYSGKYYITESRHLFYQGVYTTEFSVRGLRGGSMLNTLSPSVRLKPGQTHLVGIVTDNKDPEGWGRVRVKFPTLNPEKDGSGHSSYWARVVGIGAGPNRGFDCLPEIDDEVLVAFEHGDIHRPYVIGGVWNGIDKPPEPISNTVPKSGPNMGKVRLRTFKTRTGHKLQFVEEDEGVSKAGVHIQTKGGHEIRLNDSGSIEIQTSGNQRIHLNDSTNTINLTPGVGGVVVLGTITCTTLVTGAALINSGVGTPLNVGQSVTDLQNQLQQNSAADTQRTQEIANLRSQMQQAKTTPTSNPGTAQPTNNQL